MRPVWGGKGTVRIVSSWAELNPAAETLLGIAFLLGP